MKIANRTRLPFLAAATALVLSACGGSGGSSGGSDQSSVEGLEMPTKISVVAAQSDTGAKLTVTDALTGALADVSALDPGSDYMSDPTQTWVYDASIEPLTMVNEILCYTGQLRMADMVNQGAYYALVNTNKCRQSGGSGAGDASAASSGGVSSEDSSQVNKYEKWLVVATRPDNDSPQVVRAWIPPEGGGNDPMDYQHVLVHVTIDEGVSEANPFGSFTLNFMGVLPAGTPTPDGPLGSDTTVMNGTLKSVDRPDGKPQFTFINLGGKSANPEVAFFDMQQASNVIMDDAAGNSGRAQTRQYEMWDEGGSLNEKSSRYYVSFDPSAFLRGTDIDDDNTIDAGSEVCADRSQYNTHVWRYTLYHPVTGARIRLNSGMPFVSTSAGFGHIGYWGLWLEDESKNLADGNTITRETWGDSTTPESFTVRVSEGKLVRRTKGTVDFTDVGGVRFQWYGDPGDPFCDLSGCTNQSDYAVSVDTSGVATITAAITWNTDGPATYDEADPAVGTTLDVSAGPTDAQLWLWSNSLGGSAIISQSSTTSMAFFKEEVVQPDDAGISAGLDLVCYDRCLKGGITTDPLSESDLFYPTDGTPYSYTLSVSNGRYALTDNNGASPAAVVIGSNIDLTFNGSVDWYQWGIQNGDMVTPDLDPGGANWWSIYEADVSYRWETGSNTWNRQYALLNSSGDVVSFDKPLQFAYSYGAGDDPNLPVAQTDHPAGNFHLLEYGGPGELWGFPWFEDPDTGHGYHLLTLNNAVILTDGKGKPYIVKQIEREQTMQEDPSMSACAGLTVTGLALSDELALPQSIDSEVTLTIDDKDELSPDPAPAVIEGELQ